ncbi:MAG: HYR domain-containing protein [Chitinophagales bacterium]|nr:HYR domain-containing protein [Chitinophagales bacterium]
MRWCLWAILPVFLSNSFLFAQSNQTGLVAHYKFDNNFDDYSPNKNHGNKSGEVESAVDRFGNLCGAVYINGTKGFVSVPSSPSLKSVTSSLTICFWVKPEKAAPNQTDLSLPILTKGTSANESQYRFYQSRLFGEPVSKISLSSSYTADNNKYNNHPIDFGNWYFMAVVVDDGWAYGYVNGKLAWQSLFKGSFIANDLSLVIGRVNAGGMKYFTGCLDDLRIYNRAMYANEVSQLYSDQSGRQVYEKITILPVKDVEITLPAGECTVPYNYAFPEVEATCGTYKAVLTEGLPSGSSFPVGSHKLSFEATTTGGIKTATSFTITVKDAEPPVVTCPQNMTVKTLPGRHAAKVELPNAIATDNCSSPQLTYKPVMGKNRLYPVGKTEVAVLATDASGNVGQCKFYVTVEYANKNETAPKSITSPTLMVPEKNEQPITTNAPSVADVNPVRVPAQPTLIAKETIATIVTTLSMYQPSKADAEIKKNVPEKTEVKNVTTPSAITTPAIAPPDLSPVRVPHQPISVAKDTTSNITTGALAFTPEKADAEIKKNVPEKTEINQVSPTEKIPSADIKLQAEKLFIEMPEPVKATPAPEPAKTKTDVVDKPINTSLKFYCPTDTFITLPDGRRGITFKYEEPTLAKFSGFDTIIQTAGSKSGCFLTLGEHPFSFVAKTNNGVEQKCGFLVTIYADEAPLVFDLPQKVENSQLGNDSINYQHNADFGSCLLTAVIYDDGEDDNDMVSIIFNGQVILDHVVIKTKQKGVYTKVISLNPSGKNYLAAKAWNTGNVGLNTLRIDFYEGTFENEKQDIKTQKPILSKVLHSKPGVAGGIKLSCR